MILDGVCYPVIYFCRVILCVCVFFPFILDIKFVGRTSRGHTGGMSHRRKATQDSHPPSFCGACLNFSREKDSTISFPRMEKPLRSGPVSDVYLGGAYDLCVSPDVTLLIYYVLHIISSRLLTFPLARAY